MKIIFMSLACLVSTSSFAMSFEHENCKVSQIITSDGGISGEMKEDLYKQLALKGYLVDETTALKNQSFSDYSWLVDGRNDNDNYRKLLLSDNKITLFANFEAILDFRQRDDGPIMQVGHGATYFDAWTFSGKQKIQKKNHYSEHILVPYSEEKIYRKFINSFPNCITLKP